MSLFGLFKRKPTLQHSVFGELRHEQGCWKGSARFEPIKESVLIKIKGDATPPSNDISETFRKLESEFNQIVPKLEKSIVQLVPGIADLRREPDDSILRQVGEDDVLAIVSLRQIQLELVSIDEVAKTQFPQHAAPESPAEGNSVVIQLLFSIDEAPGFLIREIVAHSDEDGWSVAGVAAPGAIE